jgi:DNA-binding CsgD family transcriptional regulator
VLQILLYQQIFLFSFFIYGIWGNIAIHEIISDLSLNFELSGKLSLFIPILGTPFLMVSWFMLLKFGFELNGFRISKRAAVAYFITFLIILFTFSIFMQYNIITLPRQSGLFIVRTLVLVNLTIHLILIFPVFTPAKNPLRLTRGNSFKKIFSIYLGGVLLYSVLLSFFNTFGFVFTCFSILLLFGVSVILPASVKMMAKILIFKTLNKDLDFKDFCEHYEISKREAEIILEICSGKTNKDISGKLFITLQTVKDHNHRIFTKTQVKSRVQLANLVREKTGKPLPSPPQNRG